MTDGQLSFGNIYRFKGQVAPAVIFADVEPQNDRIGREGRLLYCGMTRATFRLDMVVCTGNPKNRRFLEV